MLLILSVMLQTYWWYKHPLRTCNVRPGTVLYAITQTCAAPLHAKSLCSLTEPIIKVVSLKTQSKLPGRADLHTVPGAVLTLLPSMLFIVLLESYLCLMQNLFSWLDPHPNVSCSVHRALVTALGEPLASQYGWISRCKGERERLYSLWLYYYPKSTF
jgi:hypothetical protein